MIKTRKLQLEIEEKNEIINILKDELETLREQSDKYQRENLKLIKDAKRVSFLQDENDFLQDKVGSVEKLELEIKRLKEKLNESDFLKLRVKELEEDRNKAQDEATKAEEAKKEAESKLAKISELESEVDKWKSFSHELERVRDSIQKKLLESIEQETKLNRDNKKVEDEVKRLRDLIKSYEEQRDEEQASTSLKSVGNEVMFAVNQELIDENESLKSELKSKSSSIEKIRDELESNKKLISELRQDLACEKSLAKKLTDQLAQFTKQIKNLEIQYLPKHESQNNEPIKGTSNIGDLGNKRSLEKAPQVVGSSCATKEKVPSTGTDSAKNNASSSAVSGQNPEGSHGRATVDTEIDCDSDSQNSLSPDPKSEEESSSSRGLRQRSSPPSAEKRSINGSNPKLKSNFVRNSMPSRSVNFGHSKPSIAYLERIKASVTSTTKTNTVTSYTNEQSSQSLLLTSSTATLKDVQAKTNQLHSPPPPPIAEKRGLDIANDDNAANRCTNVKNVLNCMLKHDHTQRCYTDANSVTPAQVQVYGGGQQISIGPSIQMAYPQQQQVSLHSHDHHNHHYHNLPLLSPNNPHEQSDHLSRVGAASSQSRQLNALIDPVAHEQLVLNMLQQHQHHHLHHHHHQQQQKQQPQQQHNQSMPTHQAGQQQLTEQQLAHLNNLHRQHYYHHLHELYQLHHQHHVHQHQHKCTQRNHQQQQQQQQTQLKADEKAHQSILGGQLYIPKSVGSQFQAPVFANDYDQNQPSYENLEAARKADNANHQNDEKRRIASTSGGKNNTLVNKEGCNSQDGGNNNYNQQQQQLRRSPQRFSNMGGNLPQIDEVGAGLPPNHVQPAGGSNTSGISNNLRIVAQQCPSSKAPAASGPSSNTSISTSPTSSRTSSNSSPLSTSSLDSLSTSSANKLLNRSATSRHSTTDINRRQFTIERELIGQSPMTAKLSRVGSCRGFTQQHAMQHHSAINGVTHSQTPMAPIAMNGLPSPRYEPANQQQLLLNPARAQQPPMKHASKIVNIANGGSSSSVSNGRHQVATANGSQGAQSQSKHFSRSGMPADPNRYKQLNQLANNLAEIKLNDSLAFSSLRAPRKSSSGSNLLNGSLDIQRVSKNSGKSQQANVAGGKKEQEERSLSSNSNRYKNDGNNNLDDDGIARPSSQSTKSSVWFEYGCV